MNIEQILSFLLGTIIIGGAVLLFMGMILAPKTHSEWKTRLNINTLLMDIAFGLIILFHAFEKMPFILIAVPALIITHLFREFEYFKKDRKSRFIFNSWLLALNTIKLLGLLALLISIL
ncbi:MAG: hypothetical protein JW748_13455 [Anaerolineales bacterium]|nr:hypothetical protein [Anaerolineales bacterium]